MPAVATQPEPPKAFQATLPQAGADLVIVEQWFAGRRHWVVKDPVALKYFHLRDHEHALLQMLDGYNDLETIRRQFERDFAPLQLSAPRLQGFLARLHDDGLVIADATGQGEQLLLRRGRRQRRARWMSWTSLLALRFRGIDPHRLLDWLVPATRWMFTPAAMFAIGLLILSAAALAAVQIDILTQRLPAFETFFTLRNTLWLAVALAFVKVLHELGHALACRHFGSECHEIGVMLLVFTPCLYCNVTDSWLLPSRWHRIAISAAGIIVELTLAAVCTFLWRFSEPGLLNMMCLNIMFVCSVSTLLLNGNPLLRYDGYYILSDLVEVPNLAQRSSSVVRARSRWCLGLNDANQQTTPGAHPWWLGAYAVASFVYRLVVIAAILWFLNEVLRPYRLRVLAELVAVVIVGSLLVMPVASAVRLATNPRRRREISRTRLLLTLVGLSAALAGACMIPLPLHVTAPVVLEPYGHRVYVSVPGRLVDSVSVGEQVRAGDPLARLENLEVVRDIAKLTGELRGQRLRLDNLQSRRAQSPELSAQIPTAEEALRDIEERLTQRQQDAARLVLLAPASGTVLPAPKVPRDSVPAGKLPRWRGLPLEERNRNSYLETGTLLCLIGDPQRLEAVLVIDQADLEFISTGQRVEMLLDELGGDTLGGEIVEIAKVDLKIAPRELLGQRSLATKTDETGVTHPTETSYQARVVLDASESPLLAGSSGRAKIQAGTQSAGQRV